MARFRSTVIQFWLEYIIIYLSVSLTVWPPVRPHERFSIALNWFLPHFYLSVFLRGINVDSSFRVSVVAVCFYSPLRFLNCTVLLSLWKPPGFLLFSFKKCFSLRLCLCYESELNTHKWPYHNFYYFYLEVENFCIMKWNITRFSLLQIVLTTCFILYVSP